MEQRETEKFIVDRLPTLGDAADRRFPERDASAPHHAVARVSPLMQDVVIGAGTARFLLVAFLVMLCLPASLTLCRQMFSAHGPTGPGVDGGARSLPDRMRYLVHHDDVSEWLRRNWGNAYASASGDGLGNVIIGKDGFLFYRADFSASTGPPILPSEVNPCILDYDLQLKHRGIHLILLPVPTKTSILPGKLKPDYPLGDGPALNAGYRQWIASLRAEGVDLIDLTDDYWAMAISGESPFLAQDSHWTPKACDLAAQRLADRVVPLLEPYTRDTYTTRDVAVSYQGDLVKLMNRQDDLKRWPPATVHVTQVLKDGKLATAGDDAPVLILGDSYAPMFSDVSRAAGGSADLSHQLMLRIGAGVQLLAVVAGPPAGPRGLLRDHPEVLRSKKVVIWEFTGRQLPTEKVGLPDQAR